MRKFIVKLSLLFFVLYIIAFSLNFFVDKGLRKSTLFQYVVWNDIYNSKINADMIFSGSSRTVVHLSPQIFDSVLNMNCYNIGIDGWTLNMQLARFKVFLQHNKPPKYIIQNVDGNLFSERYGVFDYTQFLPYLKDTLLVNTLNHYEGSFTFPELYFPLYKYNNLPGLILEGLKREFASYTSNTTFYYKGYHPEVKDWDNSFDSFKAQHPDGRQLEFTDFDEKIFEELLVLCKQKNIKIILDYAPVYFEETLMEKNRQIIIDKINYYSKKYDCVFLDYSNDSICYHKELFYNSQHLNKTGAEIFSLKLANDLKKMIK